MVTYAYLFLNGHIYPLAYADSYEYFHFYYDCHLHTNGFHYSDRYLDPHPYSDSNPHPKPYQHFAPRVV
jgi:hypothetical protein